MHNPNSSNVPDSSASKSPKNLQLRPERDSRNGQPPKLQPAAEVSPEAMMNAVQTLLLGVGEDPHREGLLKTPIELLSQCGFSLAAITNRWRNS